MPEPTRFSRLITALAAAALVALVGFAVFGRWSHRIDVRPGTATSTPQVSVRDLPGSSIDMEVRTITSSTPEYVVRVEYPRFSDAPGLTKALDDTVAQVISEFVKNAVANQQARRDTAQPGEQVTQVQFSLDVTWSAAQLNDRYVSLVLHVDAFEGGANMRQDLHTFAWDIHSQKPVTLQELLDNDPSYLEHVSTYVQQVLKSTLGDATNDEFLRDGTKPTPENFQWFTFTDQSITVYFPKYQVAPGAAGEQRVVLPRGQQDFRSFTD
jgi:hypothetical protein